MVTLSLKVTRYALRWLPGKVKPIVPLAQPAFPILQQPNGARVGEFGELQNHAAQGWRQRRSLRGSCALSPLHCARDTPHSCEIVQTQCCSVRNIFLKFSVSCRVFVAALSSVCEKFSTDSAALQITCQEGVRSHCGLLLFKLFISVCLSLVACGDDPPRTDQKTSPPTPPPHWTLDLIKGPP
uniref:Uncharacterized protein n=1 Tax=Knipowitschia caucasica TaxID=637954 RepID=A0AAV2JRL8_KNICA